MQTMFIALDWGTSNLKAYRINTEGEIIGRLKLPSLIRENSRTSLVKNLKTIKEKWGESPIYASGMIGSTLGLVEVPYVEGPCSLNDICAGAVYASIDGIGCTFIPGIKCATHSSIPDVLRGEEVEIIGIMSLLTSYFRQFICLPGTHSKWVMTNGDLINQFSTAMGGELFDLLSSKGVLHECIESKNKTGVLDEAEFLRGVHLSNQTDNGLTRLLFYVRSQYVTGMKNSQQLSAFCRGVIIGHEIRDVKSHYSKLDSGLEIPIIGNPALCYLYILALDYFNIRAAYYESEKVALSGYLAIHNQLKKKINEHI